MKMVSVVNYEIIIDDKRDLKTSGVFKVFNNHDDAVKCLDSLELGVAPFEVINAFDIWSHSNGTYGTWETKNKYRLAAGTLGVEYKWGNHIAEVQYYIMEAEEV